MKCERLAEQNLSMMLDFVDDENTKYDEAVLKAFLNEKNAYGYIVAENGKAIGFAYGYVLNEPNGQKVYYLHAIDVMEGWQNQGYGTELVRFIHEHSKTLGCRKMFLVTNKHNVSACRCYEKAGKNMSFGKNLQYLRQLSAGMTQEKLAEKLNVSRQTISKWEMDAANPEMDKALEICRIFNCTLDNLFREEMDKRSDAYSNLRTEEVKGFRYVEYTVISREPEADAIGRMYRCAEENGITDPRIIGWDFPRLSQEQVNVFNMHGYTAALILPEGVIPEGYEIKEQPAHLYAAIHIDRPFENPFVTIPGAYHTLGDYMRTNGLVRVENEVIPCFETDGEGMDVYIACR